MKGFLVSTWDDLKSYEHMHDQCIKWWAWEFIRRSSLYREVWLKGVELTSPLRNDILKIYEIYGKPEYPLSISYPIDSPDYSINSVCLFGEKVNPWRLQMLHNPAHETPKSLLFENIKFRANLFEDALDIDIKLKMGQACFVIDFTLPLSVQFEYVSKIASSYQETTLRRKKPKRTLQLTNKRVSNWIDYLRCLDADSLHIKRYHAAKTIFPNKINSAEFYSETLKQAKAMCDSGYIDLVSSSLGATQMTEELPLYRKHHARGGKDWIALLEFRGALLNKKAPELWWRIAQNYPRVE